MTDATKRTLAGVLSACLLALNSNVFADPIPEGWQAWNVEPIGFLDYQDRYSGKFTIKEHEGRWYLYMTVQKTQEGRGPIQAPILRVVDVTDPTERGVGNGLPVRHHRRWPPDEDAQHHR